MSSRRGGIIQLQINGEVQDAKGSFSYQVSPTKREAIIGADGIHGFKEVPQVSYIEGAVTDRDSLDISALTSAKDATITLVLANGKTVVLHGAYYAAEGKATTEEGEIEVRYEGQGEELS